MTKYKLALALDELAIFFLIAVAVLVVVVLFYFLSVLTVVLGVLILGCWYCC